MPRVDIILPAVLTAFGVVIMWQSMTQMDYFYADRGAPGPGFLPFWVALGVALLGFVAMTRAIVSPSGLAEGEEWPDRRAWKRIGLMLAGFLIFLLTINLLGFIVVTVIFLACVSYLLGMRSLTVLVPLSISMGILVHLIFNVGLRISLPIGLLGRYVAGVFPWIS